jgi:hypothetical protein
MVVAVVPEPLTAAAGAAASPVRAATVDLVPPAAADFPALRVAPGGSQGAGGGYGGGGGGANGGGDGEDHISGNGGGSFLDPSVMNALEMAGENSDNGMVTITPVVAAVPEPASISLLALCLVAILGLRRLGHRGLRYAARLTDAGKNSIFVE